jgi:hypothetical protein
LAGVMSCDGSIEVHDGVRAALGASRGARERLRAVPRIRRQSQDGLQMDRALRYLRCPLPQGPAAPAPPPPDAATYRGRGRRSHATQEPTLVGPEEASLGLRQAVPAPAAAVAQCHRCDPQTPRHDQTQVEATVEGSALTAPLGSCDAPNDVWCADFKGWFKALPSAHPPSGARAQKAPSSSCSPRPSKCRGPSTASPTPRLRPRARGTCPTGRPTRRLGSRGRRRRCRPRPTA